MNTVHRMAGLTLMLTLMMCLLASPCTARAQGQTESQTRSPDAGYIDIMEARVSDADAVYRLQGRADIQLSPSIKTGLDNGVPLEFVLEFALFEPRLWWTDRTLLALERRATLVYYELTRHYRLQVLPVQRTSEELLLPSAPGHPGVSSPTAETRGDVGLQSVSMHDARLTATVGPGTRSRNYRSLLNALEDLGDFRGIALARNVDDLPPDTQASVRLRLDSRALPIPLQPLFSSAWRLDSGSHRWPLWQPRD